MRFLKLTISYDGSRYVGWQIQNNGLAIQQVLEDAWNSVTNERLRITASGRTDAGVHAWEQICSLSTSSEIAPDRLVLALNANLPRDIRVLEAEEAAVNFHAIRDAVRKTYRYRIQTGRVFDVMERNYSWFVPTKLDVEAMTRAAELIVGNHDFSSFEAAGASREDSIRTVFELAVTPWKRRRYQFVDIVITADGFLYNMVRNIVGTLVVVGRGKQEPAWVKSVLDARDRSRAGETAPAHGLCLLSVEYDEQVLNDN